MNKLIFLLPAALLLSACSLKPKVNIPITGNETQKAEKLAAIIASGGQADCTITNLSDKSTMRMMISGKKMKIVGSEMGEGKKGTMINDSVYTYVWSEGEKTGLKTKIKEELSPTPNINNRPDHLDSVPSTQSYEDETKYQTDCTKTSILDSEFTPPAEVKFTDFSEMMQTIPTMPQIPSVQGE